MMNCWPAQGVPHLLDSVSLDRPQQSQVTDSGMVNTLKLSVVSPAVCFEGLQPLVLRARVSCAKFKVAYCEKRNMITMYYHLNKAMRAFASSKLLFVYFKSKSKLKHLTKPKLWTFRTSVVTLWKMLTPTPAVCMSSSTSMWVFLYFVWTFRRVSLQSSNPRATPTHRLYVSAPESGSGYFINARGHFIKHLIKTGYSTGHCVTFLCVLSGVGLRLLLGP